MRIKYLNIVLALALTVAGLMGTGINAEAKSDTKTWTVIYDEDGKIGSDDFEMSKEKIINVMPGDTFKYEVTYKNENAATADFYLSTAVIDTLEDEGASGGAYEYSLSYKKGNDETILYSSDTVGGDSKGLKQLQKSIDDAQNTYFEVGRLAKGEQATAVLEITLDGNSQDRTYMSKFANIDLKFGVVKADELPSTTNYENKTNKKHVVYTVPGGTKIVSIQDPTTPLAGVPATGDMIYPLIVCTVSLLSGILLIGIYFLVARKQREEAAINEKNK